jgi:hypothetical protein
VDDVEAPVHADVGSCLEPPDPIWTLLKFSISDAANKED